MGARLHAARFATFHHVAALVGLGSFAGLLGSGCDKEEAETAGAASGGLESSTGGSSDAEGLNGSGGRQEVGNETGGSAGMNEETLNTVAFFGMGEWGGNGAVAVYSVDADTFELSLEQKTAVGTMNSFGAFSPDDSRLYLGDEAQKKIRSYSIDSATGKLSFETDVSTAGGPVYLTVNSSGSFLMSAYFGAGSVETFSLGSQGALGETADLQATGDKSHAIVLSPDERFVFVPNRDSDDIVRLGFDTKTGALSTTEPPSVALQGGPRHMVFHPNGQRAYVVTEFGATVNAFSYEASTGKLELLQGDLETFAEGAATKGADIHVTPDGKYLYATNRSGANSTIAAFAIGNDGKLSPLGVEKTRGSTPRNFAIHPSGEYLLVANRESNNVATFRIGADGKLQFERVTDVGEAVYWIGFTQLPQ